MNITSCPQCGGRVRSTSIGWNCESCQGFIDIRGEFHPHKEEPFMPPMTNALSTLQAENEKLLAELERVKWERDAAVKKIKEWEKFDTYLLIHGLMPPEKWRDQKES